MICTETEAREKWCPHVRMMPHEDWRPMNRDPDLTFDQCQCIASRCMMWVWDDNLIDPTRVGSCGLSRG